MSETSLAVVFQKTPYDLVIDFLVYQSLGLTYFEAALEKYEIEYLCPGVAAGARFDGVVGSMPQELQDWHGMGTRRKALPPKVPAEQWCLEHGIITFHRHLIDRAALDGVPPDAFASAWEFFGLKKSRSLVEALMVGGVENAFIEDVLKQVGCSLTLDGLEIYQSLFFRYFELRKKDRLPYIQSLETVAEYDPQYKRESYGKRAAFDYPGDVHHIIAELGQEYRIPNEEMIARIRDSHFARRRQLINAEDAMGGPGAPVALNIDMSAKIARESYLALDAMKMEKILGIVIKEDVKNILESHGQDTKGGLSREDLLSKGKFSPMKGPQIGPSDEHN